MTLSWALLLVVSTAGAAPFGGPAPSGPGMRPSCPAPSIPAPLAEMARPMASRNPAERPRRSTRRGLRLRADEQD